MKLLQEIKINDVWGVGRQLTKFYIKNGINTAYDLKNMHNGWIKKKYKCFWFPYSNGIKRNFMYVFGAIPRKKKKLLCI